MKIVINNINLSDIILLVLGGIITSSFWLMREYFKNKKKKKEKENTRQSTKYAKDFEILMGIQKELVKCKTAIINLFDISTDFSTHRVTDYSFIEDDKKYKIPINIDITTQWWDLKSNDIHDWTLPKITLFNLVYDYLRYLKSVKGSEVPGIKLKEALINIDRLVFPVGIIFSGLDTPENSI
ncbi:MAG: hypothetical protein KAR07_03800 [Spirochaetes bacterium]|nr:hypothetical protein [Candidatus Omnitrophota bacterium]MCK5267267.1 hypothetical protein [Spirochaetota bacterium]